MKMLLEKKKKHNNKHCSVIAVNPPTLLHGKVERPITVSFINVSKENISKQYNKITTIVLENLQGNFIQAGNS